MKKVIWIGLLVYISQGLIAQHSLGLVNGNYSGVAGTLVNPSSMANNRLSADINVFAVHSFAENNYLYFPSRQSSLIKLLNGAYDYQLMPKPYGTGNRYVNTYYYDKSQKNIFINTRILGPSVMFAVQDHLFAIRTGARVMSSTRRLPYDMANFSYYGIDFRPQQNTYFVNDNYDVSAMAWWEVMVSYAKVFNRGRNNLWSAGISAGPLFGYSGAYVSGGDTRYIVYDANTLNVEQLSGEFGFSLPVDYHTNEMNFYRPVVRGYGWGMDLGITWQYREKPYQKRTPSNCYKKRFEDYKFKLGVSLIDIGWIQYSKNAEKHAFHDVHNNWIRVDQLDYDNIKDELNTASSLFYGDSNASYKGNAIRIYLPATLSMQFDLRVIDKWYINSSAFIPAIYASPMLERPFVLAVTPRYESRFLEVNLPLVLYDFKNPRFGLSIRIDGFTIGTDNLRCFTSGKDFTGADIYVSYRVMLRNDGKNPYTNRGACYNTWRLSIAKTHKKYR
jgi:hypothetical protein